MIWKRFVRVCPSCGSKDKIVRHCAHCRKIHCNTCSVGVMCIDCYICTAEPTEIHLYNKDKYSGVSL